MVTDGDLDGLFRGLADGTRRGILRRLTGGPLPVWEIAADFDMSRPAISKHLRLLREAGLVTEERRGRERFYAMVPGETGRVSDWLLALERGEVEEPSAPASVRKEPEPRVETAVAAPEAAELEDDWRSW